MHLCLGARMGENKLSCVQALAVEIFAVIRFKSRTVTAVNGVTQKRMAKGSHMHADLVRAPRFQAATKQREGAEACAGGSDWFV